MLSNADATDGTAYRKTLFEIFDGLYVRARSAKIDDKHYPSLKASIGNILVEKDESK